MENSLVYLALFITIVNIGFCLFLIGSVSKIWSKIDKITSACLIMDKTETRLIQAAKLNKENITETQKHTIRLMNRVSLLERKVLSDDIDSEDEESPQDEVIS